MLLSACYVVLQRVLQLVVLCFRAREFKELVLGTSGSLLRTVPDSRNGLTSWLDKSANAALATSQIVQHHPISLSGLGGERRAQWRLMPRPCGDRVEISDHVGRKVQRGRIEILAKMGDG